MPKSVPVIAARTYPSEKSTKDSIKEFFKMRNDLEKVMGSDESLYASIEQAMPKMEGNERIQTAVMQTVARAVSFHNKLPKPPCRYGSYSTRDSTPQTLQRLQSSQV